jgi:hypothetical protein
MSFYEYWQEKHAQKIAEWAALIEQARSWVGRRVWIEGHPPYSMTTYGEVVSVDGRGAVSIVIGYWENDINQPVYWSVDASSLGRSVTLAE